MSQTLNMQIFTTVRASVLERRSDGSPVYTTDGVAEALRSLIARGGKLRDRQWSSNANTPPPPNGIDRSMDGPEVGQEYVYWDVLMP